MRRAGLFWPLALILVGAVALLASLGLFQVSALWRLATLWPLLLILVGGEIVVQGLLPPRAAAGAALVLLVVIAGGGLAYAVLAPGRAGSGGTVLSSAPAGSLTSARLELDLAAAQVVVTTASGPDLYSARVDYPAGMPRPEVAYDPATATLHIGPGSPGGFDFLRFGAGKESIQVSLSPEVAWTVALRGAAVDGRADLRSGRVSGLSMEGAAGHFDFRLPRPRGTVAITVSGAAFNGSVHLPAGVPVRVAASGAASNVDVFGRRLAGFGDRTWTTSGFGAAADRYDVTVSGAASDITFD
ncbi:MAG: LiaI-LiaF-like domain-containing protein [Candidatus Dormibacterales bacterium]